MKTYSIAASFILFLLAFTLPFTDESIATVHRLSPETDGVQWVDSVFNSLSAEQRIAQLIMIRSYSNRDEAYNRSIIQDIKNYNIGGICFFQGGPVRQAILTNRYQEAAQTPLLIAIDGEWGLSMRLDSTPYFPRQMTLGAVRNNELIEQMGEIIGDQCRRIGIHINFAPVVDVNSNPANPVINFRSFGEDPVNVAEKGIAYMKGMQSKKVIACAKHFPGHGDTDTDSHYTLPVINHPSHVIDSPHIYPFKRMIEEGVGSIMVAHLFIPALDSTPNLATTLSRKVVKDLLIDSLGFRGLVITDALEMKGVADHHKAGEKEVKALHAGNDILLLPKSIEITIKAVMKALDEGILSQEEIDYRVKKVLAYKYWLGLSETPVTDIRNIHSDLNNTESVSINGQLYEEAMTLVRNQNNILPLRKDLKVATLTIGASSAGTFENSCSMHIKASHYFLPRSPGSEQSNTMIKRLTPYDVVIIAVRGTNNRANQNYGISREAISLIHKLSKNNSSVLSIFGNPYSLQSFGSAIQTDAILIAYQDNAYAHRAAANAIFGETGFNGKLPVTASEFFPVNSGITTKSTSRTTTEPEKKNFHRAIRIIDSIATDGIRQGAYPGCQIAIIHKGETILLKSYGNHTYEENKDVKLKDVYDLASLNKILVTTLAIMRLHEEKKVDIDQTLGYYLPYLKGTDKERVLIRDVLAHQARFKSWIPFYRKTMTSGSYDSLLYRSKPERDFSTEVASGLYIINSFGDSIIKTITETPLNGNRRYLYSDLGFYYLVEIIEKQSGKPLDTYMAEEFYIPMGLSRTFFKPLKHLGRDEIVPTEDDKVFRKQLIHGYVHDQGTAMTGGVAGHAGLFSNAFEVASIMQMLLNKGVWNELRYFEEETIKEFTKVQFPLVRNRRGLGFDKPLPGKQNGGPSCIHASDNSYGHTGFTGTYAWADPDYDLVYVFLSNRIHPNAENRKLQQLDIRTKIHSVMYEAIIEQLAR